VVRFTTQPFAAELREALLDALPPHAATPAGAAHLDREIGLCFAGAAVAVARGEAVDYVASHGLTLAHDGAAHETMQIGDPYLVRDAVEASVAFDFRRADCAAGGNGAPLVPYVDALLFASASDDVVALNIGGIANVTVLLRGAPASAAVAWDTGPGNMLIDAFVRERTRGEATFDRDGAFALRGTVDERVVAELAAREIALPRAPAAEIDGTRALRRAVPRRSGGSLRRTLARRRLRDLVRVHRVDGVRQPGLVRSGGSARDRERRRNAQPRADADARPSGSRRPGSILVPSGDLGIDADAKEALAFAVLGYETLRERPANLCGATGAARPTVLGAIAPHGLAGLLAKMHAECAANGVT
jgi:anhydro-N-acetylmuramic acid kinase